MIPRTLNCVRGDADDVLTWDLDITVGPPWREVRTAAPLVVITDVFSPSIGCC